MGSTCKNVCQRHTNIFVQNSKSHRLGIDVYFCRTCNIFIKISEVVKNFINTIFYKRLQKYRCACCNVKLRVKLRPKRLRLRREGDVVKCACGCGEFIKKIGVGGKLVRFKKNHHTRNNDIINRKCVICNSQKTPLNRNENKTPKWFKYEPYGFICQRCFSREKYRSSKKKKEKENNYQVQQKNLRWVSPLTYCLYFST